MTDLILTIDISAFNLLLLINAKFLVTPVGKCSTSGETDSEWIFEWYRR